MTTKRTKAVPPVPAGGHTVKAGACTRCLRSGADLVPVCPGYPTAADTPGMTWTQRTPTAAPAKAARRHK